jgi:2-polyprenyl-6-methoxyphenol hydroxylase-like FAD-dependent oxidoreductase
MRQVIDISVVIIGGGGCGLTLSSFLSDQKIEHILFEKHAGTSILPKAHYLNQRTMETFRHHGIDKPVLEKGAPIHNMGRIDGKRRWAELVLITGGCLDIALRLEENLAHQHGTLMGKKPPI